LKPSSLFSYALRALVDLALHQASGPVTVARIARRQEIPAQCLEQVFNRLRREGLVMAERGPRGGYRLSRHPSEIRANEIFESLAPKRETFRRLPPSDPAVGLWHQVEEAVQTTLEATTLETLVNQVRDKVAIPMTHRFTFHI